MLAVDSGGRLLMYVVRLRMNQSAGRRGRVYARVYYRRAGSRKVRHKTVSRRFVICG